MGLHSYAGGAFRKYAAKGFGSCANRESNRVPCVHISFFFFLSSKEFLRSFWIYHVYSIIQYFLRFLPWSWNETRIWKEETSFRFDKVKKKKENIFLLLFSIPLPWLGKNVHRTYQRISGRIQSRLKHGRRPAVSGYIGLKERTPRSRDVRLISRVLFFPLCRGNLVSLYHRIASYFTPSADSPNHRAR